LNILDTPCPFSTPRGSRCPDNALQCSKVEIVLLYVYSALLLAPVVTRIQANGLLLHHSHSQEHKSSRHSFICLLNHDCMWLWAPCTAEGFFLSS
jgi:hypothetical protein